MVHDTDRADDLDLSVEQFDVAAGLQDEYLDTLFGFLRGQKRFGTLDNEQINEVASHACRRTAKHLNPKDHPDPLPYLKTAAVTLAVDKSRTVGRDKPLPEGSSGLAWRRTHSADRNDPGRKWTPEDGANELRKHKGIVSKVIERHPAEGSTAALLFPTEWVVAVRPDHAEEDLRLAEAYDLFTERVTAWNVTHRRRGSRRPPRSEDTGVEWRKASEKAAALLAKTALLLDQVCDVNLPAIPAERRRRSAAAVSLPADDEVSPSPNSPKDSRGLLLQRRKDRSRRLASILAISALCATAGVRRGRRSQPFTKHASTLRDICRWFQRAVTAVNAPVLDSARPAFRPRPCPSFDRFMGMPEGRAFGAFVADLHRLGFTVEDVAAVAVAADVKRRGLRHAYPVAAMKTRVQKVLRRRHL
jgi:hypothetical protein